MDRFVSDLQQCMGQRLSLDDITAFFENLVLKEDRMRILYYLHSTGQLEKVIAHPAFSLPRLEEILRLFVSTDQFYQEMGGVAGYLEKIRLFLNTKAPSKLTESVVYHAPFLTDIVNENETVREAMGWGIEALPYMGEMIPLGGAADRLHLVDSATGTELPAAKLQFAGKTLFERLICDIQAREFLYFESFGVQITTPIAIMTSLEKDNHFHIEEMLKEQGYFGRPKDSYRIFTQPLVPVVDAEGNWVFSDDLKLVMKPGGHGAIWKLALESGVFSWFKEWGKTKVLVRQINNPMAGLDYGLLALIGIGWKKDQKFGFASCPRLLRSAEGVNVLVEKEVEGKKVIVLTNIEYCDFAKFGIEDLPLEKEGLYSRFSSNTNLLFADLASIQQAVVQCPFPGLLVNLKKGSYLNSKQERQETVFGRLESTMQNIADVFIEEKQETLIPKNTFITYNKRHKTISTTKKAYVEGGSVQETPEACFYDALFAARELLEDVCRFKLPKQRPIEEMLARGPEFVFLYDPSLGPLYAKIREKIQGGEFALGADLHLEISDALIRELRIQGSLQIKAKRLLGGYDQKGILQYDHTVGKCILKNVEIVNQGVDWQNSRPFWKGIYTRKESVEIILHGKSLLIMEDVKLVGSHCFEVFDGETVRISEAQGQLQIERAFL